VIEPVLRELPHLVVLEQHVGVRGEPLHQRRAFAGGDVDGDRALAAIGTQVVGRHLMRGVAPPGRAPGARVVADFGALDLDDVGAIVGEQLSAPRTREHAAQVEHAHALERPGKAAHAVNAWMPVIARPRISAWMSCVPS
jgi:hypothetical protein